MKRLLVAATAVLLLATGTAQAGQTCEQKQPEAANVQRSLELAERTARALDASGARVVVLARAGQDLSRYGLRWSHLGWAYRDEQGGRPVWRVVHKLNHCGSREGALYRQGLGEFFLDDLHEYVAAYAVPTAAVQQHLLPLLKDNARVGLLHTAAYNMVAYPWAQTYQQSNQWAIETLAMAEEPAATSRDRAQAWLRFKGYQPSTLHIGALTRLGARVSAAHIAFDDHPTERRFADRIDTVTVDSVFSWLDRSGLAGRVQLVR
ncbi:MAG: hypothetical protein RJA10_4702 [Pseudomonadota bacterium]|jgi:hypothetical protein